MTSQKGNSSYLRFLPPVLWEQLDPQIQSSEANAFTLGQWLRIFEKILTGIDDDVLAGTKPIARQIATLYQRFDPLTTPAEGKSLSWLAQWVALDLPERWGERESRKITSEMVPIYQKRGTKAGLAKFLELYSHGDTPPRITIDDGSRLYVCRPRKHVVEDIHAVVTKRCLVEPRCLCLGPDGNLFVGDDGTPERWKPGETSGWSEKKGVWMVQSPKEKTLTNESFEPLKIVPINFRDESEWEKQLKTPLALATLPNKKSNYTDLFVINQRDPNQTDQPILFRLHGPDFHVATGVATKNKETGYKDKLEIGWPVGMVSTGSHDNRRLIILDRGKAPQSGQAVPPFKLFTFDPYASPDKWSPPEELQGLIVDPLCFLVEPDGSLIVGDARQPDDAEQPADLIHVRPTEGNGWQSRRLLGEKIRGENNPLVAPVAVVREDESHLLVLDLGLKPYHPRLDEWATVKPYRGRIARRPALYRVEIDLDRHDQSPTIALAGDASHLANPQAMVLDTGSGRLFIADRGYYHRREDQSVRCWAAAWHEFGLVFHFPWTADEDVPDDRNRDWARIVEDIERVVQTESPAHTLFTSENSIRVD